MKIYTLTRWIGYLVLGAVVLLLDVGTDRLVLGMFTINFIMDVFAFLVASYEKDMNPYYNTKILQILDIIDDLADNQAMIVRQLKDDAENGYLVPERPMTKQEEESSPF